MRAVSSASAVSARLRQLTKHGVCGSGQTPAAARVLQEIAKAGHAGVGKDGIVAATGLAEVPLAVCLVVAPRAASASQA